MKTANFLNLLLAVALVLLCAELHFRRGASTATSVVDGRTAQVPAAEQPTPAPEPEPATRPFHADAPIMEGPLPPPQRDEMPLGEALAKRRTDREFSTEELTAQELSDLLWAASGFNRRDERKLTAPTAINRQEIDIYVCRRDGAYLWKPFENDLKRVSEKDLRGLTGRRGANRNFALDADIALVYVVDWERQKMQDRPDDAKKYAHVDCGFIGQNVYLHCAAAGLRTVFLGSLDPAAIAAELGLPETRTPVFAQTVGKAPRNP